MREKTSGVKIHIGVDINGLPPAVHVTTANITDRNGALEMFEIYAPHLTSVVKALVDGGYTGEKFANAVNMLLAAIVEVAKRNELHTFAVIPKR